MFSGNIRIYILGSDSSSLKLCLNLSSKCCLILLCLLHFICTVLLSCSALVAKIYCILEIILTFFVWFSNAVWAPLYHFKTRQPRQLLSGSGSSTPARLADIVPILCPLNVEWSVVTEKWFPGLATVTVRVFLLWYVIQWEFHQTWMAICNLWRWWSARL